MNPEPTIAPVRQPLEGKNVKLSVVIVNYRGWKRLKTCLASLTCLRNASFGWEVIVIDNHSNDGHLDQFIKDYPTCSFYEAEGNYGFAHGCNEGARRASGTHLLFLNPDTIVTLETLQALLQHAVDYPTLTIVSCDQLSDAGKDTKPYGLHLRAKTLTSFMRTLHRLTHKEFPTTQLESGYTVMFPDWISGSVVLMSRANFDQLGGWDEDFWMYYEDADLCRRTWIDGGKVALIRGLNIEHNHGGASRINLHTKALTKSEVIISRHVYLQKYYQGLTQLAMHAYLVINNVLLFPLLMALLGLIFFFIPKLRIYPRLYARVVSYYWSAMIRRTWVSPRSVNYPGKSIGINSSRAANSAAVK